ncbi:T9SS type A sorting domain-containing protein, partial [Flammeovirga sp. SJP92]|uniref:T9SS type A sorting domain-containing protein n=1 Tax=Flammeovirga sp. SJP92 TaxID=1775430 RepID=UPI000787FD6F
NFTLVDATQFIADSLALLSLKIANPQINVNWSTQLPISEWEHITHSGSPADPVSALNLVNIDLNTIPIDFSNDRALLAIDSFDISSNHFTFYDLYNAEAIINQSKEFTNYQNQSTVGEEMSFRYTGNVIRLSIDPSIQDDRNDYQWYKDGILINSAVDSFYITSEVGSYVCKITNTDFNALTLSSAPSFIFDQDAFEQDSIIVSTIASLNTSNTLGWDFNTPISTWNGVTIRAGRVQNLSLKNKRLDVLPDNIGDLTEIDSLRIGNNDFSSLPVSISLFPHLKLLDISDNAFTTLQDEIYELTTLEVLEINGNELNYLDPKISNLQNTNSISIENNHLSFDDIDRLPTNAILSYTPQGIIGEEQNIATSGYIKIQIDPSIDATPEVEPFNTYQWYFEGILLLGANQRYYDVVSEYGEYFCTITNSNYPNLTLKVASIFVEPGMINTSDSLVLVNIKELNPSHTLDWSIDQPVRLWEGIKVDGASARITDIDIWNKNIDILPTSFATLDSLKSVNISANNIFELPDDIGDLEPSLTYFNASQNHLTFAELDKVRISNSNQRIHFVYGNQKLVGEAGLTITLENGVNYLKVPKQDQTENDAYQWYYNGSPLEGETTDSLRVNNIGEYNYTITNSHYKDIVLTSFPILVDGVTGIKNLITSKISVYPNPTDSDIHIQTSEDIRILEVSIFDVTGKEFKVASRANSMYKWTIDMQDIPSGMYLVKVNTNKGITAIKVSKR